MTVILQSDKLRAGGYGDLTVVDPEYDYAFRANEDRISGAPLSQAANDLMTQAQLGYKLSAWGSDTVVISVKRDESTFCRVIISLYRAGDVQLSSTMESTTLADCIREFEKKLETWPPKRVFDAQ